MNRSTWAKFALTGVAVSLLGMTTVQAYSGEHLAGHAKITMSEAQAAALKAYPGTITDQELEQEKGGSGLRYSFDVKGSDGVVNEVGIDAQTGAVLENDQESDHPD